jgi:hypothetical protein
MSLNNCKQNLLLQGSAKTICLTNGNEILPPASTYQLIFNTSNDRFDFSTRNILPTKAAITEYFQLSFYADSKSCAKMQQPTSFQIIPLETCLLNTTRPKYDTSTTDKYYYRLSGKPIITYNNFKPKYLK